MVDAHAHLDVSPPSGRPEGVGGWVVPGVDAGRDANTLQLSGSDPRLYAAAGLHPWYLPPDECLGEELASLQARVGAGGIVAIGETGLDKGRRAGPRNVQRMAFRAQLEMASRAGLPLILHVVRSHGACLEEVGRFDGQLSGMVHDFQGPIEMITPWLTAGFMLSISPRALGKEEVIRSIPARSLLLETDDEGWQQLPKLCEVLARIRGVEVGELARQTDLNARALFGLSFDS